MTDRGGGGGGSNDELLSRKIIVNLKKKFEKFTPCPRQKSKVHRREDRQTDRQTDRPTDRQTDRHCRQTDKLDLCNYHNSLMDAD